MGGNGGESTLENEAIFRVVLSVSVLVAKIPKASYMGIVFNYP
jgi:hypothetical protein